MSMEFPPAETSCPLSAKDGTARKVPTIEARATIVDSLLIRVFLMISLDLAQTLAIDYRAPKLAVESG